MSTTYGSTTYRKKGIKEQKICINKLNEIFISQGVKCIPSTVNEDKRLGIDCWFIGNNFRDPADIKVKKSESSLRYGLTSYNHYYHEYIFDKSKSKYYIFVSNNRFLFIYKDKIKKWYEDRHKFINNYEKCGDFLSLAPGDNSKYFYFPLSEAERLTHKIINFK